MQHNLQKQTMLRKRLTPLRNCSSSHSVRHRKNRRSQQINRKNTLLISTLSLLSSLSSLLNHRTFAPKLSKSHFNSPKSKKSASRKWKSERSIHSCLDFTVTKMKIMKVQVILRIPSRIAPQILRLQCLILDKTLLLNRSHKHLDRVLPTSSKPSKWIPICNQRTCLHRNQSQSPRTNNQHANWLMPSLMLQIAP
jgi:hypothetical protein